jgi:hypothetical protein
MPNTTNTIEFLKTIYPENDQDDQFLTIYTLPNKRSVHVPLSQIDGLHEELDEHRLKQNQYYGIGLKNADLGPSIAGNATSVMAIPAFWADIDIKGPGHKQEALPETLTDAIALAYSIAGFPPSIIVSSGGGIQPYWLFKELWTFDTPEERKQAEALLKRFGKALIQQGALKKYKIDNVSDLARKLRLPGTFNIKNPDNPIMARVIESHDDRRYNPGDFDIFACQEDNIEDNIHVSDNNSDYGKDDDYEPADFSAIYENCAFIRHCKDNAETLSEPEWYDWLTISSRCKDGRKLSHEISEPYPQYSREETNKKIDQALKKTGPLLCETLKKRYPTTCSGCKNSISTPLHLGRNTYNKDPASKKKAGSEKDATIADKILTLLNETELFFADSGSDDVYARISVNKHKEVWPVRSKRFKRWIIAKYKKAFNKHISVQSVQNALDAIESETQERNIVKMVHTRIALYNDCIYLDLCDDRWRAIKITKDGWDVVTDPPVMFVRNSAMKPLPVPTNGGSLTELKQILNIDERNFVLSMSWLVGVMSPHGPYPILTIDGLHGVGKTIVSKTLRSIIDPTTAPLRHLPKDKKDLLISAEKSLVLAYDNVSSIQDWLSDALCRMATGGGDSWRQLYEDREEVTFQATRPILLNGICINISRHDFLDRTINCKLERISSSQRRTEAQLLAALDEAHPRILGALCTATAEALKNKHSVEIEDVPRMADFAFWVTAAEPALPWENGKFLEYYRDNIAGTITVAVENDPVAWAIMKMANDVDDWEGTPTEFYNNLCGYASDEAKKSQAWPKDVAVFGKHLKRIEAFLHDLGYFIEEGKDDRQRTKRLRRMGIVKVSTMKQGSTF